LFGIFKKSGLIGHAKQSIENLGYDYAVAKGMVDYVVEVGGLNMISEMKVPSQTKGALLSYAAVNLVVTQSAVSSDDLNQLNKLIAEIEIQASIMCNPAEKLVLLNYAKLTEDKELFSVLRAVMV